MTVSVVFLLEDNPLVRDSIVQLLRRESIEVQAVETVSALLKVYQPSRPGCLLLDLHTPGTSGRELYEGLLSAGCIHPFIIITGLGTISDAKEAIWRGAIDFLEKPVDPDLLLERVRTAFEEDARRRREQASWVDLEQRIESLTPRQREVLDLVVEGRQTKQIARELGVSIKTIEAHRSIITKRMGCDSVAQLVRSMAEYRFMRGKASDASGSQTSTGNQ